MNIANRFTVLRIVLAGVFIVLLYSPGLHAKVVAAIVFLVAALTDIYDGYLARTYNLITDLGKFLDPLADKILVMAAFIGFVEKGVIPGWMLVIIISRELILTGVRLVAAKQGVILAASRAGKHKTISQMISIMVILVYLILREAGSARIPAWSPDVDQAISRCIYALMLVTVSLTVYSGIAYLRANSSVFKRGSP